VSSQNEGEQPDYAGADPLSQFDAFRARQADDRAQQETQSAYSFPPEYAADPAALAPPEPPAGYGRGPGTTKGAGRLRSVAIFGAAVALAAGIGIGAYAAFGSSGPAASTASGGTPSPTPAAVTPTATPAAKHGRTVTVRVVIESIGPDSFTGRLVATGQPVTVRLEGSTRFGTAAHPFSRAGLSVGETVLVRGRRTADATLAATLVDGPPTPQATGA
jgi:hypothetical protein